jgi:hypothetical protein
LKFNSRKINRAAHWAYRAAATLECLRERIEQMEATVGDYHGPTPSEIERMIATLGRAARELEELRFTYAPFSVAQSPQQKRVVP